MNSVDLAQLRVALLAGTLGQGGAERQLFYIARALHESGTQVRVISLTQGEHWEKPLQDVGVPVSWLGRETNRLARLRRITANLRTAPAQIIQSQHFYTNLYAALAGRFTGTPDIGAIRSNVHSEIASHRWLGGVSLRAPSWLAANSRNAIHNAEQVGVPRARLHWLPNVIDTTIFQPSLTPRTENAFTVLMVGRMSAEKRFDLFIHALAALKYRVNRAFPIRGVLVGDGPLRSQWERLAATCGLTGEEIHFAGAQAEMTAFYQRADAVVLLSDFEGTPNVILEAMACGLPALASAVGDLPLMLRPSETGWVIALKDDEDQIREVAQGLYTLARDANRRRQMGAAARAYVLQHHALAQLAGYLRQLYQAVLA